MQEIKQPKEWYDTANKNTGGEWPTTNETLVNNYLQIFVNFVKSIDFYRSAMTLCLKDR